MSSQSQHRSAKVSRDGQRTHLITLLRPAHFRGRHEAHGRGNLLRVAHRFDAVAELVFSATGKRRNAHLAVGHRGEGRSTRSEERQHKSNFAGHGNCGNKQGEREGGREKD